MEIYVDLQKGGDGKPVNVVFMATTFEDEEAIRILQGGNLTVIVDGKTSPELLPRYAEGQTKQVDFVE